MTPSFADREGCGPAAAESHAGLRFAAIHRPVHQSSLNAAPTRGRLLPGWRFRPTVAGSALCLHPRAAAKDRPRTVLIGPAASRGRQRNDRTARTTEEADGQPVEADLHGEPR